MLLEMSFPVLSSDTAPQSCSVEAIHVATRNAIMTTNSLNSW